MDLCLDQGSQVLLLLVEFPYIVTFAGSETPERIPLETLHLYLNILMW